MTAEEMDIGTLEQSILDFKDLEKEFWQHFESLGT
jgi:hypothetical protein